MRLLRSTWGMRLLVALTAIGALPLVAGPAARLARPTAPTSHADGLRERLLTEAGAAIEEAPIEAALKAAAAAQPRSLRAFLQTFVEALQDDAPGLLAERGLVPAGLSAEATVDQLQRRLLQLASHAAALHVLRAVSGGAPSAPTPQRLAGALGSSLQRPSLSKPGAAVQHGGPAALFADPLRLRWAAFPLGP